MTDRISNRAESPATKKMPVTNPKVKVKQIMKFSLIEQEPRLDGPIKKVKVKAHKRDIYPRDKYESLMKKLRAAFNATIRWRLKNRSNAALVTLTKQLALAADLGIVVDIDIPKHKRR